MARIRVLGEVGGPFILTKARQTLFYILSRKKKPHKYGKFFQEKKGVKLTQTTLFMSFHLHLCSLSAIHETKS